MSLGVVMRTALSGLTVNQVQLQQVSGNIANINTAGYTRKIVNQQSLVIGPQPAGVAIASITRKVDAYLMAQVRTQTSATSDLTAQVQYFAAIQDRFGTLSGDSSLAHVLGEFTRQAEALAATADSSVSRLGLVDAARSLALEFNQLAEQIQELRRQADGEIGDAIAQINAQLEAIADLNSQISRGVALNQPVGDLQDQRDQALNAIAEMMDVRYFERPTGELVIYTAGGRTLVDGTVRPLSHTAAGAMIASYQYYPPGHPLYGTGNIDGIYLGTATQANDITAEIGSGKLAGLIEMRDSVLPDLAAELEELATQFMAAVNAAHNRGSAAPPPNTLTGQTVFAGGAATALAGTGNVRIAVVAADGTLAAPPLNLDLSTVANVGALIAAINAGRGGAATASLNANNQLQITATNPANGVAVNEDTSSFAGTGFSQYFQLNNLFVSGSTTTATVSGTIAVRSDLLANPNLLAHATLSLTATAGQVAVSRGDATAATRLAQVLANDLSFAAAGGLPASTMTVTDYAAAILSRNASQAAAANGSEETAQSFLAALEFRVTSQSGVNLDEELANMQLLQQAYQAAARMLDVAAQMFDELINNLGN